MASPPIDDPRIETPTFADQVAVGVARGFQTALDSPGSVMAETTKTLQEVALAMTVVARQMNDRATAVGTTLMPGEAKGLRAQANVLRQEAVNASAQAQVAPSAFSEQGRAAKGRFPDGALRLPTGVGRFQFEAEEEPDYRSDIQRRGLQSATRENLRATIHRNLAQHVNERFEHLYTDPETGRVMELQDGFYVDPSGRFRNALTNTFAKGSDAVAPATNSTLRRYATSAAAMKGVEAWRSGQPVGRAIMSAAPTGALKVAGAGAILAAGGMKAWERFQSEYAKNRELMSEYGYGHASALGDRLDRWWTTDVRGRFSLLGSGAYKDAWESAMGLGLRGDDRGRWIDEYTGLMTAGSMSSQQTRRLMETAVESGQGLAMLADSIKEVNRAALDAGRNARQARDLFIANYEASTGLMFGGAGALPLATAMTTTSLSLGRPFSDVSFGNNLDFFGGGTGEAIQRSFASRAGISYGEYVVASRNDPTLAVAMGEQSARERLDRIASPDGRTMTQVLNDFMSSERGRHVRPSSAAGLKMLGDELIRAGFRPATIQWVLRTYAGINASVDQAPAMAARLLVGGGMTEQLVRDDRARIEELAVGSGDFASLLGPDGLVHGWNAGENNVSMARATSELSAFYVAERVEGVSVQSGRNLVTNFRQGSDMSKWAYQSLPLVEEMLRQQGALGISLDTKIEVRPTNGEWRIVTLREAITNYPDALANGDWTIVEGADEAYIGKSAAEIFRLPESRDRIDLAGAFGSGGVPETLSKTFGMFGMNVSPERITAMAEKQREAGVSLEEWGKTIGDSVASADSKVTVELALPPGFSGTVNPYDTSGTTVEVDGNTIRIIAGGGP